MKNQFKIIGLSISGVRKITALEMSLSKNGLIPIIGGNQQGKTTVLDVLEMLLRGGKAIPADMIQHGLKKSTISGVIEGDNDRYVIERVIKHKGKASLKITDKKGYVISSKPQAFLDTLYNEITFDPMPFIGKDSNKKLSFLMSLLKIDFTDINKEIKRVEEERLIVGRECRKIGELTPIQEVKPIKISTLIEEKSKIEAFNHNQEILRLKKKSSVEKKGMYIQQVEALEGEFSEIETNYVEEMKESKQKFLEKIAKMKEEYKEYEKQALEAKNELLKLKKETIKNKKTQISDIESVIENLAEPQSVKSVDDINDAIASAEDTNNKAKEYEMYINNVKIIQDKNNEYSELTKKINKLRESKKEILMKHKMPIDGLQIVLDDDDKPDGVYFDGIHSDNWSDAQGIRISCELCIAMNPKLRAIMIDRGESFDKKALKALQEWAINNDIQTIITIVDEIPEVEDRDENSFYIESGSLV